MTALQSALEGAQQGRQENEALAAKLAYTVLEKLRGRKLIDWALDADISCLWKKEKSN